ncbi:MAG: 3'-5' exonuclease [Desulfovibrio sp.]|nr:3'-5' exonuclease [Desulfovibrio sp.]MCA1986783.1 3'-5' exonuclease [Desulfovibrio sp.]
MHTLSFAHSLVSACPFLQRLFGERHTHPAILANNAIFRSLDQNRPIEEYDFVVLDTELTGFSVAEDAIVSIGAVRIRGMRLNPADSFFAMVDPGRPLPKASTLVHRITPQAVEGRPRLQEVLPALVEYCNGSLIVGHHIGLDMRFLNHACSRYLGGTLATPCLDTLKLAQVYEAEQWENYYDRYQSNVSYQLGDLAVRYGLPLFDRHDALQDAMQTAYLFLYLVRSLRQGGIATLKDLYLSGRSWRFYF